MQVYLRMIHFLSIRRCLFGSFIPLFFKEPVILLCAQVTFFIFMFLVLGLNLGNKPLVFSAACAWNTLQVELKLFSLRFFPSFLCGRERESVLICYFELLQLAYLAFQHSHTVYNFSTLCLTV